MDTPKPVAEIFVDEPLLRRLLTEQHPEFADAPIEQVGSGWDNTTWRVGHELAARLPRRAVAAQLLANEQRWMPEVTRDLGVPVSEHVRLGRPTSFFPWPWSLVRWLPGATADVESLDTTQGAPLARILAKLHRPAPPDAPPNPFRGVPLRLRDEFVLARLDTIRVGDPFRTEPRASSRLLDAWRQGLEAPEHEERVWIHGDLHPRNVLVADGRLVGLIDWGDLTAGDAATDVAAAWTLIPAEARDTFWSAYPAAASLVDRARAWSVFFGLALFTSGEPRHVPIGRRILENVLTE